MRGWQLPLVLPTLAFALSFSFALVVMIFEGVAHRCLNVTMNAQGVAVELENDKPIMSRLHAVFVQFRVFINTFSKQFRFDFVPMF